jgi:DNA-binding transcriptional MerR regulator
MAVLYRPTQGELRTLKQHGLNLSEIREVCRSYTDRSISFKAHALNFTGNKANEASVHQPQWRGGERESLMTNEWTLRQEVYESLCQTGIDMALVMHQLELFKTYWIARAEPRQNWDSMFIGRLSHLQPIKSDPMRRSIQEELNDTSWANGLR